MPKSNDRYAAIKAEKKALAEERKKLQCRGYGFSHRVPARAIPTSILEAQEMVYSDGSPIDGVDAKDVNRLRRQMRLGRL